MAKDEDRIYNSRLIDTYFKLLRAKYPQVNIDEVLRSAGLESYEVADQGVWFTQSQINRFYTSVCQVTGNENIAREAGNYSASPDALGTMRQVTLGLLGPGKAFKLIGNLTKNLTKSSDYKTREINANSVEVVVRLRPGVTEEPFQCENRIGFFEALVSIFNYKSPQIEHEECMFKGGAVCRYVIRWQSNTANKIRNIRDLYAIASLALNIGVALIWPEMLGGVLLSSLVGFLGLSWWFATKRLSLMEDKLEQFSDSSEQLTAQLELNSRNVQLSREIGEVITSQSNIDDVIGTVVQILEKTLDYDRGLILLANETAQHLEIRGAFGYSEQHLDILESTSFRLDNPNSQGPFIISYRQKKPILVNDADMISDTVSPKSLKFIQSLGIKSFLTVPIILQDESIGILAVDNHQRKQPLANSDLNLLMGIAPTIGISFRNAALNEARENQFAATLRVLAQSIDARDFLTAGHSEIVSEYSVGIAMALDLSHDYCQMIRVAALLHDYGKIGVPDTVLKKNGPLTASERSMIETHPEKSRDILAQVPFEGCYQEIPLIALHHHERWDGKGYPSGLSGETIPFGARIVAVADFYEAITAERHYRDPMSTDEALTLLRESSGTHFDPHIVDVFLRYIKDPNKDDDYTFIDSSKIKYGPREPRGHFQSGVRVEVAGMTINGETVDISTNGVFLRLDRQLIRQIDRYSNIRLEMDLNKSTNVKLEGEVRWINQGNNTISTQHPTGIGISFRNIDERSRMLLQTVVNALDRHKECLLTPQG